MTKVKNQANRATAMKRKRRKRKDELDKLRRDVLDNAKVLRNRTAPFEAHKSTLKKILHTFSDRRQENDNKTQGYDSKGGRIGIKKLCDRLLPDRQKKVQPGIFANGLKGAQIYRGDRKPDQAAKARIESDLHKLLDDGKQTTEASKCSTDLKTYLDTIAAKYIDLNHDNTIWSVENQDIRNENDTKKIVEDNRQSKRKLTIDRQTTEDSHLDLESIDTTVIPAKAAKDEDVWQEKRCKRQLFRDVIGDFYQVDDVTQTSRCSWKTPENENSMKSDEKNLSSPFNTPKQFLWSPATRYKELCSFVLTEAFENCLQDVPFVDPLKKVRQTITQFYTKFREKTVDFRLDQTKEDHKSQKNNNYVRNELFLPSNPIVNNIQLLNSNNAMRNILRQNINEIDSDLNSTTESRHENNLSARVMKMVCDDPLEVESTNARVANYGSVEIPPNFRIIAKSDADAQITRNTLIPSCGPNNVKRTFLSEYVAPKVFTPLETLVPPEAFIPRERKYGSQHCAGDPLGRQKLRTSTARCDSADESVRHIPSILRKSHGVKAMKNRIDAEAKSHRENIRNKSSILYFERKPADNGTAREEIESSNILEACNVHDQPSTSVSADVLNPASRGSLSNTRFQDYKQGLETPFVINDLYERNERFLKAKRNFMNAKYRRKLETAVNPGAELMDSIQDMIGDGLPKVSPENFQLSNKPCAFSKIQTRHHSVHQNVKERVIFIDPQKSESVKSVDQNVDRISVKSLEGSVERYPVILNRQSCKNNNRRYPNSGYQKTLEPRVITIENENERPKRTVVKNVRDAKNFQFINTVSQSDVPQELQKTSMLIPDDSYGCTNNIDLPTGPCRIDSHRIHTTEKSIYMQKLNNAKTSKNRLYAFDDELADAIERSARANRNTQRLSRAQLSRGYEIPYLNSIFNEDVKSKL